MRLYCKSFERDRKSGFDDHSNELVVDYIPLQTVKPSFKLQASTPEGRVRPRQCWNSHQTSHRKDHRQVNVSKSRLQGAGVKLRTRGGKLRYELAQRLELALLFDGSITGDRICSFCIESIVVRMNEKVVSDSNKSFWPNEDEQPMQFRGRFRIPTASSHSSSPPALLHRPRQPPNLPIPQAFIVFISQHI